MVTADGGVESAADWSSQEAVHARLAFYQSLAALKALVGGGDEEEMNASGSGRETVREYRIEEESNGEGDGMA